MLWIDTAILMLTGLTCVLGLWRGCKRTMFAVIAWTVAMITGWFFSQDFALLLIRQIPEQLYRMSASFLILMLITLVVGWVIGLLLGKTINNPPHKITDRLYGCLLGTLHAVAIVLAVVILAGLTPLPKDSWWRQSVFLPWFQGFVVNAKWHSISKFALFLDYSPRLKTQAK